MSQRLAFLAELPNPYELLTVWEHMQFVAIACGLRTSSRPRRGDPPSPPTPDRRNDLVLTLSNDEAKLAAAAPSSMTPDGLR